MEVKCMYPSGCLCFLEANHQDPSAWAPLEPWALLSAVLGDTPGPGAALFFRHLQQARATHTLLALPKPQPVLKQKPPG